MALDPDDIDAVAVCRRLAAVNWIRIIEWGHNTGLLDQRQRQLATQLASLASNGWVRDPSIKEAKEGRRIINLANEHEILHDGTQSKNEDDISFGAEVNPA